ncbi:MAG: hypothetical protein AABX29_03185 [Nanoarchaeota archaeon]
MGLGDREARLSPAINLWKSIHKTDLFYRFGSPILQDVEGKGFLAIDSDKVIGDVLVEGGYRIRDETEYESLTLILKRALLLRNGKGSIPECKVEIYVDFPESGFELCYSRRDYIKGRLFGYRETDPSAVLLDDWFFKEGILRREPQTVFRDNRKF